jgi:DMSO/TMAO reductase YedYZ molybdopterin-dependent catalytic subunit
VQVDQEVFSIQFTASDGYKSYIPYELAIQPQTIIAYERDGVPLEEQLRLILPGTNGAAWIAMITSITMSTSGANYPEGVTVGGANIAQIIPPPTSSITTPPQTTSKPQPTTPANSSNITATSPANATITDQLTPPPQVSKNQETNLEIGVLTGALVSLLILSIAGYLIYKRKISSVNP